MLSTVLGMTYIILTVAMALSFVRLVKGPSTPDRVVALELIASIVVCLVAVHAISSSVASYLDVAIVMALTAFLAAIGFARYVERGSDYHD